MIRRKCAALAAAGMSLFCAGLLNAQSSPLSLDRPVYLADSAPADPPLMGMLDTIGLAKPFKDAGLTLGGWIEASYTYNVSNPPGDINAGRVFDTKHEDPTLNQMVIFLNKDVDMTKPQFQVGGRMEWMWGSDARFIHSNGLFDHYSSASGPNEQFDLTQLYVDLMFPVGSGLKVRIGKFVTTHGFETINPNSNSLYSHSYLFGFAIPFTHTGVLATYNLTKDLSITGGITRGWEQSLEDNNGSIDFLGSVAWTINDKWNTVINLSIGPQRTGNSADYRYLFDICLYYKMTKELTLGFNGDYGWEQNGGVNGEDASWYGTALYATYAFSEYLALNARGEWFSDPDGARGLGVTGSVFEVTVGVDIKPLAKDKNFSTLRIRPEFRWDYSTDPFFDGGTKHNQFTFAVDAIFGF